MSDGRILKIRALKREDEADVMPAVARTSPQCLYRGFFGFKRFFSDQEIAYYMTVNSVNHVCLVAVMDEDSHPAIVGGVRHIVQGPGKAEVSFAVIDEHQAKRDEHRTYAAYRRRYPGSGDQRILRRKSCLTTSRC